MGLDVYLYKGEDEIKMDDERHPDHLLKIGYFRSSYNGAGLNNVLRRRGLLDLADIFEPSDAYEFKPDWHASLQKATETLTALKESMAALPFTVSDVGPNPFVEISGPKNETEALRLFAAERKEEAGRVNSFEAYSNSEGLFYVEGRQLFAAIPGTGYLGQPVTYLIFPTEDDDPNWYCAALEIVVRTIEYVLAQPGPEAYSLHWSG